MRSHGFQPKSVGVWCLKKLAGEKLLKYEEEGRNKYLLDKNESGKIAKNSKAGEIEL